MLYFDGCPNHEALLPRLRELLPSQGISTAIELRVITTIKQPSASAFLGSPTIRVNVTSSPTPRREPTSA